MSFIVVSILNVDCSFSCILYSSLSRFEKGVLEILLVFLLNVPVCYKYNKKAQLMLAYPRDAKTMKKIPPFRSYNKFQSSRKSGVYSN